MTNTQILRLPAPRKWLAVVAALAILVPVFALGSASAANAWTCGSPRTSSVNYHSPVRDVNNVRRTQPFSCTGHSGTDWVNDYHFRFKPVAVGTVYKVGEQKSCHGIYIVMEHSDGNFSVYAHLKEALVSKGEYVSVGEEIGIAGDSGKGGSGCNVTGVHLHLSMTRDWEGWDDSSFFDPEPFIASH